MSDQITESTWQPPQTEVELLERARHIIAEEKRWIQGTLIEDIGKGQACNNVGVCAVGAMVIAYGNGQVVDRWFGEENDIDEHRYSQDHPLLDGSLETLNLAVKEVIRSTRIPVHTYGLDEHITQIERFNDYSPEVAFIPSGATPESYPDAFNAAKIRSYNVHLKRIIRAFDRAIELAKAKVPNQPTNVTTTDPTQQES
jgi:hypothetical protein